MIELRIDPEPVLELFTVLEEKANELPLSEIGDIAVADVHALIDNEGSGNWDPPLVPQDHPLLKDSGTLYDSIVANISTSGVIIDSSVPYAGYQNAMREFMVLSPEADAQIMDLLAQHFTV